MNWIVGSWRTLGWVVMSTALIYVSTVLALRTGVRRTLAELTVFDFTVAVALGGIVARTATASRPPTSRA